MENNLCTVRISVAIKFIKTFLNFICSRVKFFSKPFQLILLLQQEFSKSLNRFWDKKQSFQKIFSRNLFTIFFKTYYILAYQDLTKYFTKFRNFTVHNILENFMRPDFSVINFRNSKGHYSQPVSEIVFQAFSKKTFPWCVCNQDSLDWYLHKNL